MDLVQTKAQNALFEVRDVVKKVRLPPMVLESVLQRAVEQVLLESGIAFERECVLSRGNRVDFLTKSGVAIEIKRRADKRTVAQLLRYASHEQVQAVLLVCERTIEAEAFSKQSEKPFAVVSLRRNWGVAV